MYDKNEVKKLAYILLKIFQDAELLLFHEFLSISKKVQISTFPKYWGNNGCIYGVIVTRNCVIFLYVTRKLFHTS